MIPALTTRGTVRTNLLPRPVTPSIRNTAPVNRTTALTKSVRVSVDSINRASRRTSGSAGVSHPGQNGSPNTRNAEQISTLCSTTNATAVSNAIPKLLRVQGNNSQPGGAGDDKALQELRSLRPKVNERQPRGERPPLAPRLHPSVVTLRHQGPIVVEEECRPETRMLLSRQSEGSFRLSHAIQVVAGLALLLGLPTLHAAGVITYLGGSGEETIHDVAVDSEGDVWVVGETNSADFPGSPARPARSTRTAPRWRSSCVSRTRTRAMARAGSPLNASCWAALATIGRLRLRRPARGFSWPAKQTRTTSPPPSRPAPWRARESLFLALIDRSSGVAYLGAALIGGPGSETMGDLITLDGTDCVALAATTDSPGLGALNAATSALPEQPAPGGGKDVFLAAACGNPQRAPAFPTSRTWAARPTIQRAASPCCRMRCASAALRVHTDFPVSSTAGQPVLTVGIDGFVTCYRSTLNSSGGGGFFRSGSTFAGGSGANVDVSLAPFPDDSGELLIGVLSDSPVRLFDSGAALQMAGGSPDNPGSNPSLAFGAAPRSLDVATRRFWMGGAGVDQFLGLDSDGSCTIGLADLDGSRSLIRFCSTDGAGGPRIRHAQTVGFDPAHYGGVLRAGRHGGTRPHRAGCHRGRRGGVGSRVSAGRRSANRRPGRPPKPPTAADPSTLCCG